MASQTIFVGVTTTLCVASVSIFHMVERRREMASFADLYNAYGRITWKRDLEKARNDVSNYAAAWWFQQILEPPPHNLEQVFAGIDTELDSPSQNDLSDAFAWENPEMCRQKS